MQVALYARVSTPNQQQEGTIDSQVRSLKLYIQQQGWTLLPEQLESLLEFDHRRSPSLGVLA